MFFCIFQWGDIKCFPKRPAVSSQWTLVHLVCWDVHDVAEGGVVQSQKLQRPLQLLERDDAALAGFNAGTITKTRSVLVQLYHDT